VENANVGSTGDSDEASPPKNDANQNNGQEWLFQFTGNHYWHSWNTLVWGLWTCFLLL
jgi:hypothetical protein